MARMRKIATEEAFSIPEVARALKQVVRGPSSSLDKLLVKGIYDSPGGGSGYGSMNFLEGLIDIEDRRLKEMDELGVDMHLLPLTAAKRAAKEMERAIRTLKLNGFILNSHTNGE
jgi:2,3-dihydroxybenzoate decarboxylase/5-carboxyvanillate decarboxylase